MRVCLYVPEKLYGFCEADALQVFFHIGVFAIAEGEPPPILGEPVDVEYDPQVVKGPAPRALKVTRIERPLKLSGDVKSFDPKTGWGFIAGSDGRDYFLHRSDVVGNRMPVKGQRVSFYAGAKRGRPRACHIEV